MDVRLPDGTIVTNVPEGITQSELMRRVGLMAAPQIQPVKEAGFSLGDIAKSFGIGAAGSTKALTDVAGAENVISSKLGRGVESLQQSMTPERQAELQRQAERMKAAEESGSILQEIKAGALNVAEAPLQSAAQAIGSFVPYLPALFAAPAARALQLLPKSVQRIEAIAAAAPKVIGTAQGAGAVKGSIYEGVLQAEIESGVDPEIAKQKADAAQSYFGGNFDQIALGAGLGLAAGSTGVERFLTPTGRAGVAPGLGRRVAGATIAESLPEAAQGGQERLAENIALQRAGYDVDTFKGVAGAATQEALTGALGAAPIAAVVRPEVKPPESVDAFKKEEEEFRKQFGETKPVAAPAEERPAEVAEPPVQFPGGYTATRREISRREVPESFGIFAKGSDQPLTTVASQEEVQKKIESLTQIRKEEQERLMAEGDKIMKPIEEARRKLEIMEATGKANTDEYVQAKAILSQKEQEADDKFADIFAQINSYSAPLSFAPIGSRVDVQNEFVVNRGKEPIGVFPTLEAAELTLREREPEVFKRAEVKAKTEELESKLKPMLVKFNLGDVGLNIVEQLENNAGGAYLDRLIKVSLEEKNPIQTMRHESLHALKNLGFFTPQQWNALKEQAEKRWIKEYLENAQSELDGVQMSRLEAYKKIGLTQEEIIEEAIADAFGAYDRGAPPPPGMIAALFKKLKNFFTNFGQALRGAGFESADDIFQRVERGELKARKPKEEKAADKMSLPIMRGEETPKFEGPPKEGEKEPTKIKPTVDLIGKYFDDQVKEQSGSRLDYNDKASFDRAVKLASEEVSYQLQKEKSGLDWYEDDVKDAFKQTKKLIPELGKTDNRLLFSVVAGIMSPQTTARDNWFIAAKAFQNYVDTGVIPGVNPETGGLWQGGTQSPNKKIQLDFLDKMVRDMGQKKALEWLFTDHTVKEINSFRSKYGNIKSGIDGKLTDMKPGLYAFGPKVGPFVANLNGIHDVTVDKWMTRTFNRYFGAMLGPDGKIVDAPTEPQRRAIKALVNEVAKNAGIKPYQVQSLLWFYEQQLFTKMGAISPSYGFSDGAKKFTESRRGSGAPSVVGAAEPTPAELKKTTGEKKDEATRPKQPVERPSTGGKFSLQRDGERGGQPKPRAITPLAGAPSVAGFSGPIPEIVEAAERYAKKNGIPYRRQASYVEVNPDRAKRIADAYEKMPHDPQDPAVKEAYEDLIRQTIAQYEALVDAGYKFWFMDMSRPDNQEYASSPWNAMRDLKDNKEMGVFPTNDGFGSGEDFSPEANPLLAETKFKWPVGGLDGKLQPVLANDLFRAVHDAFGHGIEGAGFRAQGEENAWQAHVRLFTGPAIGAITSETRGQNSWLNYGPYGEKNRTAKVEDTKFADQKTGLMPRWTWSDGLAEDEESGIVLGKKQPGANSYEAVHYGNSRVDELDATKYGTGLRGAERRRLDDAFDKRIKNRVYFYIKKDDGSTPTPESGVGQYVYTQKFNNILPPGAEMSRLFREANGDSNDFETNVIDAGYDGYAVPSMGMMVILNHNVPVNYVGPRSRVGDVKFSLKNVAFPSVKEAKEAVSKTEVPDTPEFKRFIAGSQWVDKDGKPKVFYHATAREFFEFTPAGQSQAIFLADTAEEAETFGSIAEDRLRREIYKALTKDEKLDFFQGIIDVQVKKGSITEKQGAEFMRQAKRKVPEYGDFGDIEAETYEALIDLSPTRMSIMPLYARAETPFDFENPEHVEQVMQWVANNTSFPQDFPDKWLAGMKGRISQGLWQAIEDKRVQQALRALGFDAFTVRENRNSPKNYAVYKPEQVKSITGNIGEYGRESKDIRFSLPTIPANINDRINQATFKRQEKGFVERMVSAIAPQSASSFRQRYLNRYNQMSVYDKKLAEQMGGAALLADQSAESAALMSDLGAGIAASAMGFGDRNGGIPVLRNGITTVDNGTKGLIASLAPLAAYGDPAVYQRYQYWAMVKRGQRLNAEGKLTGIDTADVAFAKFLEQKHPEFVNVQKDLIAFNNGLVKYMVDTGVLSKERGHEYTKHADYIPFYRQMDDGEKTLGPNLFQSLSGVKPPKKLKGKDVAEAPLADFLETMVRNTQSAIQAGIKNYAAQRAIDVASKVKAPGMGVERLPVASTSPDVINVLEKGQIVSYRTPDNLLIEATKSLNLSELPFMAVLSAPADFLRNLVTKDPGFMMANLLRDSMSAWVTSGQKMTPIAGTVISFGKALTRNSPGFEAMQNAGIIGGYEFSANVEQSGLKLEKDLAEKAGKKAPILLRPFTSVWDALEKGTTASDAATRALIYERVLADTGNEAEALYRSLEVMNFHRKGNSPLIRVLTATVPFFNARLQGLDLFYRASTGNMNNKDAAAIQRQFWSRGMTMMALSTAYWFMVSDDEEYKKQEQETRDNNWIIPSIGVKIPIPFEVGVLFKVIPERIAAYTFGDDTGKDLKESALRNFVSTFAFNPTPQIIKPVAEAIVDFNPFTWRSIVSKGMEDVEAKYQVGPSTSTFATVIAQSLGLSPLKVDHIIKGYTGTIGMYGIDAIDMVLDQFGDSPKPTKRFEQLPVIKRFASDPEARGYVTQYYELKDAVDTTVRTMNLLEKTGESEEYVEYLTKNQGTLAFRDYIRDTEKVMKEFREMRLAIRSSDMTGDEKRDALLEISKSESAVTSQIQLIKKAIASVQ